MMDKKEEKEKKEKLEDIAVYESLRNEIISAQNTRTNMFVYMYTVYAVLFGLGVERSRIFFFIAFLILFSFQSKIERCKYTIARISAYTKVFFEEDPRYNIHWEKSYDYLKKKFDNKDGRGPLSKLSKYGSMPLGGLSLFAYIASVALEWKNKTPCKCECGAVAECIKKILCACGCETCKDALCKCSAQTIPFVVDLVLILISIVCIRILYYYRNDYIPVEEDEKELERLFRIVRRENYPDVIFKGQSTDVLPKKQTYWAEYTVHKGDTIEDHATGCFIRINSISPVKKTVQIGCYSSNKPSPVVQQTLGKGFPEDVFKTGEAILTLKELDEGVCTIIIWRNKTK